MKTKLYWFIIILILFSCNFFHKDDEKVDNEPSYHAKVAWRSDTECDSSFYGIQENNHLYVYDTKITVDKDYTLTSSNFRMVKIDLDTGEVLWKSQNISRVPECAPVVADNKLFVLTGANIIHCFDANNGGLLAIIQLADENHQYRINWSLTAHNDFLYFGFGRTDTEYLACLNVIDSINYNNGQDVQLLFPEILWESRYNSRIRPPLESKDNIICFMTSTAINREPMEFTAIHLGTKEIVWEKLIGDNDGRGYLFLHDDTIFMMTNTVSAYNILNGERIYSRSFPNNIDDNYAPGTSSRGTIMYNDRLYYTNSNFYNNKGKAPNIVCLESSNGSTVWGRLAYRSSSLGVIPAIANGKVFLPLPTGFNVLDAETGELLGIDKNFYGSGSRGVTFQYKNLVIFPNGESNGYFRYIAVDISE